jgi:endogenous inhibitor of DNA gyrase (YacG/DUF329 family)
MSEGGEHPPGPLPARPARECPICGRPAIGEAYPFCSKRCADVDLGRWFSGAYVIPGPELDEADAEQAGSGWASDNPNDRSS